MASTASAAASPGKSKRRERTGLVWRALLVVLTTTLFSTGCVTVSDTYCTRASEIDVTAAQQADMRSKPALYRPLAEQIVSHNDLYAEKCE